jgi:diaminopimelate decarboxylase
MAPVETPRRIDDCLSVRGGRLFVEGIDAGELTRRFGSPLHVVSEDQLRRNARRFTRVFAERWPDGPVAILPALKANTALATRAILSQEGLGCDTFGAAELWAALRAGVDPARLSVNGSIKDASLIETALHAGAKVTLDSVEEFALIREIAARMDVAARARVRLRPVVSDVGEPSDFFDDEVPTGRAIGDYKAGIPTEDLLALDPSWAHDRRVRLVGAMVHFARHTASPDAWGAMARAFVGTVARLSEAWGGWVPEELDLGGGLPTPRDPTGRLLSRLSGRAGDAPPLEAFADAITGALRGELQRSGLPVGGVALEVEPGRGLYADAGVHLATVRHVKRETTPELRTWVELDSSEAFLPDSLIEHNRWRVVATARADEAPSIVADVVGRSCGFDVMAPGVALPAVEAGDVVAFLDTGAYQDAASSNFNAMPRPATVLVRGDRAEVIRRAETVEDVFRRDAIPGRLEPIAGAAGPPPGERAEPVEDVVDLAAEHRRREGEPRVQGIHHVSITCADLDRSVRFYGTVLGLPLRGRGRSGDPELSELVGLPGVAIEWAELELGRGQILELLRYVSPEGRPVTQRSCDPGSGHFALEVSRLDELDARLRAAGFEPRSQPVTIDEPGDWYGCRCLYVSDPDGATIELLERPVVRV